MGLDICGWIEIKSELFDEWVGVVKIDRQMMLGDRNKEMQAYLFAPYTTTTNYKDAKVSPIAPQRGQPDDISQEFLDSKDFGRADSWVMWEELKAIPWLEKIQTHPLAPPGSKIKYVRLEEKLNYNIDAVMTGGWELIFALMEVLARFHGDENVRLVVGFG